MFEMNEHERARVRSTPTGDKWEAIGLHRRVGLALPLTALRTKESVGCGEIMDLEPFIDLCHTIGVGIVQLLPCNDTGSNTSPYSARSAFALHPILLSLHRLTGFELEDDERERIDAARAKFDDEPRVRYDELRQWKLSVLETLFDRHRDEIRSNADFTAYRDANRSWLEPYAIYTYLKERFNQRAWYQWPPQFQAPTAEIVNDLREEFADEIAFVSFVQWQLETQFRTVHEYAKERDIQIMGDIPILIDADSADAWFHLEIFNHDRVAGAPPDMYSSNGQYWGFPTYRWDVLEARDYDWWVARLQQAEKCYDMIRIDHVLGFFRIWTIPKSHCTGLLGYMDPQNYIPGEELANIDVSFLRLLTPSIGEEYRRQLFPDTDWDAVAAFFSYEEEDGRYYLDPKYASEEAVHALCDNGDAPKRLRKKLIEVVRNRVLLKPDPEGEEYTFKWNAVEDEAFTTLPEGPREQLRSLFYHYMNIQEGLWEQHGRKLLSIFDDSTAMLLCAEDLGTVPACVRPTLKAMGIPGLRVVRWTKNWDTNKFIDLDTLDPINIATPSVHDSSTMRGWWRNEREEARQYYHEVLGESGRVPAKLDREVHARLVGEVVDSATIFCVFLVEDLFHIEDDGPLAVGFSTRPSENRINVPGTNTKRNWTVRFPFMLGELAENDPLLARVRALIHPERKIEGDSEPQ